MLGFGEHDFPDAVREAFAPLAAGISERVRDAEVLLVPAGAVVGAAMIAAAPELRYIGVLGTEAGGVDREAARARGITVTAVEGYSTEAVAEMVFALLLHELRLSGRARAIELRDRTFGVVGLGRIGSRVAELARGFGAKVIGWSRRTEDAPLEALLARAEFISVHLPLAAGRVFDRARIERIQRGAIVIALSPLSLFDIEALSDALEKRRFTFITDDGDELPHAIVHPPIACTTEEARAARLAIAVDNLKRFLARA